MKLAQLAAVTVLWEKKNRLNKVIKCCNQNKDQGSKHSAEGLLPGEAVKGQSTSSYLHALCCAFCWTGALPVLHVGSPVDASTQLSTSGAVAVSVDPEAPLFWKQPGRGPGEAAAARLLSCVETPGQQDSPGSQTFRGVTCILGVFQYLSEQ